MEFGLIGLPGLTVQELANPYPLGVVKPYLETSLENTGQELVPILHLPTEAKTVKDWMKTWNCVTRIILVVSYDFITITNSFMYTFRWQHLLLMYSHFFIELQLWTAYGANGQRGVPARRLAETMGRNKGLESKQ